MRTNTGMTIYNKYIVAGAEVWQRTQIAAVKWENRKAANVIKSGLLGADSVVVYIPMNQVITFYVRPIAWTALTVKTGLFTLKPGDFMVKGLITDEITGGYTMASLKAAYDDCVKITSVDRMDAGSLSMHHFQIGAS